MSVRWIAAALVLAALGLQLGVTVPLRRQAGQAGDEYRRMRDERRKHQTRLTRLERGERLRRGALATFAAEGRASEDMVRRLRRSVVDSVDEASLSRVRIAVRPGSPSAAAAVTVSAEGEFEEVVRLSSRLVRAGTGLVLRSVSFTPRPSGVGLLVEALGPGGPS